MEYAATWYSQAGKYHLIPFQDESSDDNDDNRPILCGIDKRIPWAVWWTSGYPVDDISVYTPELCKKCFQIAEKANAKDIPTEQPKEPS